MSTNAVRYEFINVLYSDGEYMSHLLKIRNDGEDDNGNACDYVEQAMIFTVEDAITNLSETLRFQRKRMTVTEYDEYVQSME